MAETICLGEHQNSWTLDIRGQNRRNGLMRMQAAQHGAPDGIPVQRDIDGEQRDKGKQSPQDNTPEQFHRFPFHCGLP